MYGYNPSAQMQANQYAQSMRDPFGSPQYGTPYMPTQQRMQSPQIISPCDLEGARNAQIPMDGSPTYFANPQTGEIYVKRLSMVDGSIIFEVYRKETPPAVAQTITADQYNDLLKRIEKLEGEKDV